MQFIPYLLDMEKAYYGAGTLFRRLENLGIDPAPYRVQLPYIFSASEMAVYALRMAQDLRGKPPGEDFDYVLAVCRTLSEWAAKGYLVHVH